MTATVKQARYVAQFQCLGSACEDTCCQGWGMQVDQKTYERYREQAPELLDAVVEGEAALVMRRDAESDFCVKLSEGWCGIHKRYGSDFLGDACHFYPRITRKMGDQLTMGAALSCPEVARLSLFGDSPFAWEDTTVERAPELLRRYEIEGLETEQLLRTHDALIVVAGDETLPPEHILARLLSVSAAFAYLNPAQWAEATPFYFAQAPERMAAALPHPADPFHLVHVVAALQHTARKSPRTRLLAVMERIKNVLGITIDADTLGMQLAEDAAQRYDAVQEHWYQHAAMEMVPVLRRYIQAQMSMHFSPFSGLGATPLERMQFTAFRFAVTRLGLMTLAAEKRGIPSATECVEIIQPLSRFLDHLADPDLSLALFNEAGWREEGRWRALVGDF